MPEAKAATAFRRDSQIEINGVTFQVAYNPYAATLGDFRREQTLADVKPEDMTEDLFAELVEFRATLLARQVIEWDVTAFGRPVPLDPEALTESLDATFMASMLYGLREDMSPKDGGEPMPSSEPPSNSVESTPSDSTTTTPRRPNSKTAPSPTA